MKNDKNQKRFSPGNAAVDEASSRKQPPPRETRAEIYYYKKQIEARTNLIFVLQDGEEIKGAIEWYDQEALKIIRQDAPNLVLLRHNIKYFYKEAELE